MELASEAKRALRAWARALPPPSQAEEDAVLAGLVTALGAGLGPPGILLYLGLPDEIHVERLRERLPGADLFVTRTPEAGPLTVHRLDGPLERHPLGFWQPSADASTAPLDLVGVVLVPGLAFDGAGGRLGRGRGHYDRLLGRLPGRAFVGVTLNRRLVAAVPREPHDVAMTHLATEDGLRKCESNPGHTASAPPRSP